MKKIITIIAAISVLGAHNTSAQFLNGQFKDVKVVEKAAEDIKENQGTYIEPGAFQKPILSAGKGKNKIEFSVVPKNNRQEKFETKHLKRKTETINENCLSNYYESSGTIQSWKVFDAQGNSAVSDIVPGAVYDISDFDGSFFKPVESFARQPIRISLNKSVQASVTETKVRNPKQIENIRDKGVKPIQQALRKKVFGPTVRVKTDFKRQYSSRDLEVALGGSIPYIIGKATFNNKYTSNSSSESYTYLLEFEEDFYTLKATGNAISNRTIFTELPAGNTKMAYVEKVVYGRKIVVIVSSSTDLSSMTNSFSVKNSGAIDAEVSTNSSLVEKEKNINYEIFLVGGKSNYNIPIGVQNGNFNELLDELSDIISKGNSNAKDAVPIRFTMKDLNGNTLVSTYSPYETKVKACQPKFKITLESLEVKSEKDGAADNKLELYGSFKVDAFTALTNKKEIFDTEASEIINGSRNAVLRGKTAASSGLTTFATKEAPIKRGKNKPKNFDANSKESGGDVFALTNDVEDSGYLFITVNAHDKDKMSANDDLNGNSGKIKFTDIGGYKKIVVNASGKPGTVAYTFIIEKIN